MYKKGDFYIPAVYKGIKMRSLLECKIALFLDKLGIKWQYEPERFFLSIGVSYLPDFYLPELDMYIEGKGKIDQSDIENSLCFCKSVKKELLIITYDDALYFENWVPNGNYEGYREVTIGQCSKCGKIFFCNEIGVYHCRYCGFHNGDHDIVCSLKEELDLINLRFYGYDLKKIPDNTIIELRKYDFKEPIKFKSDVPKAEPKSSAGKE